MKNDFSRYNEKPITSINSARSRLGSMIDITYVCPATTHIDVIERMPFKHCMTFGD